MDTKIKATLEAVIAAAEAIEAEGGRASVRNVMERLGGGSPNVITAHLRTWREQKPLIEQRRAIVIDPKIADLIAEQVSRAAAEASAEAITKRDEVQADNDLLAAVGEALEKERDQLQVQLAAAAKQHEHNAGMIEQLQHEVAQERVQAAEAIRAEREAAAEAVAKFQAEAAAARQKADELNQQVGTLQTRVDTLKERLAEVGQDLEKARADYAIDHGGRIEAERLLAVVRSQVKDLEDRATTCTKALEEANTRAKQAERERADAAVEAAGAKASAAASAEHVASLKDRIKDLETALAKANAAGEKKEA